MNPWSWLPDIKYGGPRHSWCESLAKALVYRLFMVAITIVIAYVFTTDSAASVQIGVVTNVIKTGTYYAYERIWDRFRFEGPIDG